MGWVEQDLARYEREQELSEQELPICDACGERIYGDYAYRFPNGDIYCEDCIEEMRVSVIDLMRW